MKKLVFAVLTLVSLKSFAVDCQMTIENISGITLNWSSLSATNVMPISLASRKANFGSYPYCFRNSFGFSRGNSSNYTRYLENIDGDKIYYNLHAQTGSQNILEEVNTGSPNNDKVASRNIFWPGTNYTTSINFKLAVDSNIVYPAGTYTDNILVSLYNSIPSNDAELEDTSNLNFSLVIPEEVAISLVTSTTFNEYATTHTMDFGPLEKDETMGVNLIVKSNAGYKISATSTNLGKLKHVTESDTISYKFTFDGKNKKLNKASGRQLVKETGVTPTDGVVYPIEVKIGNIPNNAQAGLYTDSILITVEAN